MSKIIAVDFDGTLCTSAWPGIGAPKQAVIAHVLAEQKHGAKLILWTNRTGDHLNAAVEWCKQHGLEFDAINDNLPEMIAAFNNNCRKVYADEYIDDKAVPVSAIENQVHIDIEMHGESIARITRQKLTRLCGRRHIIE